MKIWVIVIAFELAALLGLNLAQLHTYVKTENKNAETWYYIIPNNPDNGPDGNFTIKQVFPKNHRKSLRFVKWQEE